MANQEHRIDLGEEGEILLIVNNPWYKFWKKAEVVIDLSECKSKGYTTQALKELPKIATEKLKGREFHFHFLHFG